MKKSQLEELDQQELKEMARAYGHNPAPNATKSQLIKMLIEDDHAAKPSSEPIEPEVVDVPAVAENKGNTQVVTELEKKVKELANQLEEMKKYDIRVILARKAELQKEKDSLESRLTEVNYELEEIESFFP